jgi:hypothetical protein
MQTMVEALVHQLDPLLRRAHGVREFTDDPRCLLRVAIGACPRDLVLCDGTQLRRGEPILELHLWNERIPRMPPEGPDLAWGLQFYRQAIASVRLIAQWMESHPEARKARALRGETSLIDPMRGLIRDLGFEVFRVERGASGWRWLRYRMDDLYLWMLMQAYNPASLRGKRLQQLERVEFWISRERFLERYGNARSLRGEAQISPPPPEGTQAAS